MTFSFDTTTQLWLEISPASIEQSWQQSQSCSTPEGRWHTYLNQICLNTFLPWLQAEYEPNATAWQTLHPLAAIWEVVNGTAIEIQGKRLILIPSKSLDTSEFYIPQEWVDLPSWIGDYYLAVQINLDEGWLRIWGYTTHQEIVAKSSYDASDRNYYLEEEFLNQDITLLWVIRQVSPAEPTRATLPITQTLQQNYGASLLQRLSNPDLALLRLQVPFEFWGTLLEESSTLERLYQQRRGVKQIVNLGQWWQNRFEETWQSLENLMETGYNASLLNLRDSEQNVIKRVKLVNLEGTDRQFVLLLVLETEPDRRLGIRVRLGTTESPLCLPSNLRLALISASGEILQSVEARSVDNFIQLKRFKCPKKMRFSIEVSLDNFSFIEEFTT
ncbi:hypothetical protein C7H19_20395 [Aphanothece hegewaldii CCALA 016]|uniref:DUF1822 domain-containing protein n=2 Tax=Aphanothece TaxID=1121 RepID=A0A2T1LSW1_9CHRO|nr:hypothetical protein C7H19_20395 [Aphanothece hegewaldii CCALA 016]